MERVIRFYIHRVKDGVLKNLEVDFEGLRYKEAKNVNSVASAKVYTEEFAEEDGSVVFLPDTPVVKQGEFTLVLYFIAEDGDYARALGVYESFMDFVFGHEVVYYDTFRRRKIKCHLEDKVTPKQDVVNGVSILEVELKFKNDMGRSYRLDDPVFAPVVEL